MKISVIGLSIIWGGFWGMAAFYCVFLSFIGFDTPYKLVCELCFGLLPASLFGAVLGGAFGFAMGFGSGIVGGSIYNFVAGR